MHHNVLMKWDITESWKVYLLIAIVVVVFSGLFGHHVWTPDEPRVAAIIQNMYLSNNFIIPQFAGIAFVEKPPLFFLYAVSLMHLTGLDAVMAGRLGLALLCLASLAATFRIAWLLNGQTYAWICLGILATLEGLVLNFHWLRVDAALMFTTIAAIWAFAEAYLRFKWRYLLLAGGLTGLAFLSKGPVAIVLCIGLAWIPLFLRYLYLKRHTEDHRATSSWIHVLCYHIAGVAVMCLVIAAWVYPFYKEASPELWHAWFWENQIGRLTGASTNTLGHNNQGKPFYYVHGILEYTLPWTAFFICWLVSTIKKIMARRETLNWLDGFFLFWFCLAVFILSYSVTKRSMYLAPLMPLFALMTADAVIRVQGSWSIWYRRIWLGMMVILLTVFTVTPLWVSFLPDHKIPQALMTWLTTWHSTAIFVLLAIILMIKVEMTAWPDWTKLALITSLFFSATFVHLFPAVDVVKDMKQDLDAFVDQIPQDKRTRTAGIKFTETMSSLFYLYQGWSVPLVDKDRARQILDGKDSEYDYLIVNRYNSTADPLTYLGLSPEIAYQVLVTGHPRTNKQKDAVLWIKGLGAKVVVKH